MKLQNQVFLLLFVLITLPLAVLFVFTFERNKNTLIQDLSEQLEALATIQENRIEDAIDRYLDWMDLITSRTALRTNIDVYNQTPSEELNQKIQAILLDAQKSLPHIQNILVFNPQGEIITSTGSLNLDQTDLNASLFNKGLKNSFFVDFRKTETNQLLLSFSAPLLVENRLIGVLAFEANAVLITDITGDYSGLRETGEVLVAKRDDEGNVLFIVPLRFKPDAAFTLTKPESEYTLPMNFSLDKIESVFYTPETRDYVGNPVIAATRHIESLNWGLVTKYNQSEAFKPIYELRRNLLIFFFTMIVIILLLTFVISTRVTKPIISLTTAAKSISKKDFSVRARINSKGEIGQLAKAFNLMAEELQSVYTKLDTKVKRQTTDLENETHKLQTIVESIGDGVFVVDTNGKIIIFNKAAEKISGYLQDEVIGKKYDQHLQFKNEKTGRRISFIKSAIERNVIRQTKPQTKLVQKNGSEIYIASLASPLRTALGKTFGAVVTFRDTTQQEEVDRMKTEFITVASHQLRTPLTAIRWGLEVLLSEKFTKAEQIRRIEEVHSSTSRMISLVNSLLNVSRLETGEIAINPEKINAKKLVEEIIHELSPLANARNCKISFTPPKKLPTISLDAGLFRQVLHNIIGNAVQYTSSSNGIIDVQIKKRKQHYEFSVTDNGIGITKENQEKIFNKFYRGENAVAVSTDGNGLGLYIAKMIIEQSGGSISFTSTPNKQTTFTITLPLTGMHGTKGKAGLSQYA